MGMTAAAVFFITADYYSVTNPVIYFRSNSESSGFGDILISFGMDAERHRKNQQQKTVILTQGFQGNHPLLPDIVFHVRSHQSEKYSLLMSMK